jgi:hypothetical protein
LQKKIEISGRCLLLGLRGFFFFHFTDSLRLFQLFPLLLLTITKLYKILNMTPRSSSFLAILALLFLVPVSSTEDALDLSDYVCDPSFGYQAEVLRRDPLMIYLKGFISERETDHFIALA